MISDELKSISEELRKWVEIILGLVNRSEQKENDALSSLLDALNETMIYLGRVEDSPEKVNRESEESLSRLWRTASQKVRPYNQELAKRCNSKGLYWGNPTYYTETQINEMKISITEMQDLTNKAIQSV